VWNAKSTSAIANMRSSPHDNSEKSPYVPRHHHSRANVGKMIGLL